MKNKTSIPFWLHKGLNKTQAHNIEDVAEGEKKIDVPAKIVSMYPRAIPIIKQAKIISMFN